MRQFAKVSHYGSRIIKRSIGDNLPKGSPIFQYALKDSWDQLPLLVKKRFANRYLEDDQVEVNGQLTVKSSLVAKILSPFLRIVGSLVPYEGENVPVTVKFVSTKVDKSVTFDRTFFFPGKEPYRFLSTMAPLSEGEMVEYMRFGLGWKFAMEWSDNKIKFLHRGYVLNLFDKVLIPLPIALVMGEGYAEEAPLSDTDFAMKFFITHPLWGEVFSYNGKFTLKE